MWKPTYAEGGGGDRRWLWPWSGSGQRGGVGFLLLGFLRVWVCVLVDSVGVLGCGGYSTIWPGKNGHLWGVDAERCEGGGWETMLGLSLVGVSNSRSTRGRGLLGEEHWPGCVAICVHVGGDEEGRKIGGGRSLVESSGRWSRLVLCRAMEKGGGGCWSVKDIGVVLSLGHRRLDVLPVGWFLSRDGEMLAFRCLGVSLPSM